jgi:hypothetical protein
MKWAAAVIAVMLFVGARAEETVAQIPQRVTAPFSVIGSNGTPLVAIVEPGDLSGGIYLHNAAGNIASVIGLLSGGPSGRVAVFKGDRAGGSADSFGSLQFVDDVPKLVLESGKTGVGLFADPRTITLNNMGGDPAIIVRIQPDGSGQIRLGDPRGRLALAATVLQNGVGAVMAGPSFGLQMTDAGLLSGANLPWALVGKQLRK